MRSILSTFFSSILLMSILWSTPASAKGDAPVVDAVPDAVEFAALKAIYDNLGGANWTTKTNWPVSGSWPSSATSAQFGTWFGVTVTNGDITKIVLSSNNLVGTLPSEIGSLKAVTIFNMYGNAGITGSIPAAVGGMTALKEIYLYSCGLSGNIPSELFNITGLQIVYADHNNLSGSLPASLVNATALTSLVLHENDLTGSIPSDIGNLRYLTTLSLHHNNLSGTIPASMGSLSNLVYLLLHVNQLSGSIPASLGNLSKVVQFYLNNNNLTGSIPPALGNLASVQYFYIYANKLSGQVPAELGNITKVKYFYINDNQLTGTLPVELSKLTQTVTFYAYNNKFSGILPSTLFNGWGSLSILNISNNQFTGDFPSAISTCRSLVSFAIGKNLFSSLPSGMLNLSVLVSLTANNNELKSIPDFTTHVNKANLTLNISYNRLDFGSLQPLIGAGIKSVTSTPQNTIQDVQFVTPAIGAPLTIPGRAAGTNGTITWKKQQDNGSWTSVNSLNGNTTQQTYTRSAFAASDEGIYRMEMTSTSFSGITIQSDPIKVKTAVNLALDNWAFQYKYDGRHRMTQKKVPGADWVYMVYDNRDRLVMTQDGEQRKNNQWLVTKYDGLNRPIMTAIYTHTGAASQSDMAALISTTNFYDSFDGTSTFHGYTNNVFPNDVTKLDVLTVTYYDSYDYKNVINDDRYNYKSDEFTDQYKFDASGNSFPGVIGQVTGIKSKVLGAGNYIITANYYDDKYRVVQSVANDMHGDLDRTTNVYDFVGKVLKSKSTRTEYGIQWTNVISPAVVNKLNNALAKAGGSADGWNAGASSVQVLPAGQNGWVEVTATELTKNRMVGLASSDPDGGFTSINYALYMVNSSFSLQTYESGVKRYNGTGLNTGDVLRVERKGTTVTYRQNGKLIATSAVASTTDLRVDASLYSSGATLADVRASFAARSSSIVRTFEYDHAGRLLKTWHQVNGGTNVLLVNNTYNELGQLITKKLHSEDQGTNFKQHVDMRYNIRGWLTRINNSDLTPDQTNDPRDHFGMNLSYNETVATLNNTPQFNGNISAIRYSNNQGFSDIKENAYQYTYDPMNRITGANFRQKQSSTWAQPQYQDANNNTVTTNAYSETDYKYDQNGNIQQLTRIGKNGITMDRLTYYYGTDQARSNKLLSVSDAGDIAQGFIDGNLVNDDYLYDNNGSMNVDKNKDIASITYNHLNLPVQVTKGSGEYIKYIYDASGRKLCQQVYNASNALTKQTDYAGEYFYENDTLKFINHEEGRIVMTGTAPEYQYHLKDHLGNVRVTFTSKNETESATATLETANASAEQGKFLYYNEAVKINFRLFDHTRQGSTNYSTRLNGTANERTGLAKSLSVMPGDVINTEVYAKYLDTNQTNWSTAVNNLITSIANGTAAAGTYVDGGAVGSTGGTVDPFASILNKGSETGTAPKAYLNYLIFDRNYNVLDGGFVRMTEAAKESGTDVPHEKLSKQLIIKEAGYVYIYLSNDNAALGGSSIEVYFDDLKIEHTKSPVIQSQEYYPFGLTFNSYSKENSMPDLYQYNGKKMQHELGLEWLDYGARMYMPDIGRWGVVDPHSDKYEIVTPYNYAFNNPMLFVDPNGKDNVIYLLTTAGFNKKDAQAVADKANAMFKKLGLKTQVKLYDAKKNGKFDERKLDKTDNWAVIGTDRKAIASKAKEISSDKYYQEDVQNWSKEEENPELANNTINGKGIVVDYDDNISGKDKAEESALYTIHAAGHSSETVQSEKNNKGSYGHHNQGVMQAGGSPFAPGLKRDYQRNGLTNILDPQNNKTYIKGMMERYGTNKATDNYNKK